jgi:hypothetical protein
VVVAAAATRVRTRQLRVVVAAAEADTAATGAVVARSLAVIAASTRIRFPGWRSSSPE